MIRSIKNFFKEIVFISRNNYNRDLKIEELTSIVNNNRNNIEELTNIVNNNRSSIDLILYNDESEINKLKKFKENVDLNLKFNSCVLNKSVKEPIKVIFLYQIPSFWPSWDSVYELMKNDNRFEIKLVFLSSNNRDTSQMKNAKKFLEDYNLEYVEYSEEFIDKFKPDVMFIQTPYDFWHRDDNNNTSYFLKKGIRLVYIPYGLEISCIEESLYLQYKTEFFSNMWKIYTLNENTKNEYIKYSNLYRDSIVSVGSPKFDSIFYKKKLTNYNFKEKYKDKKIVVIKAHFRRQLKDENGVNHLATPDERIYLNFLKDSSKYKNCLFIFLTHPKFFDYMSQQNILEFKKLFKKENIFHFEDEDYREALYDADIFITDRSAVMIEMGTFDKPILYLHNDKFSEPFSYAFEELINSYYEATDLKGIHMFLKDMLEGKDLNNKNRIESFKRLTSVDGKVCERIVEDIYKSLNK